jgi:hypothetical protein
VYAEADLSRAAFVAPSNGLLQGLISSLQPNYLDPYDAHLSEVPLGIDES